jgi:hypothetical protein
MINMRYLLVLLIGLSFLFSCKNTIIDHLGVAVRVVNNSDIDFDTLRFQVSVDSFNSHELIFTDLNAGEKSDVVLLDQLEYMYYDESSEFIFFSNLFYGITEDQTLYETGYGFCGTGLMFKTVYEGGFEATITGTDEENNRMYITQERTY